MCVLHLSGKSGRSELVSFVVTVEDPVLIFELVQDGHSPFQLRDFVGQAASERSHDRGTFYCLWYSKMRGQDSKSSTTEPTTETRLKMLYTGSLERPKYWATCQQCRSVSVSATQAMEACE